MKTLLVLTITLLIFAGCEVTPYRHIFSTGTENQAQLKCAMAAGIPVLCGIIFQTQVEVPVEVLVPIITEKVVEVEKVVEIETIIETITTEYVNRNINVDEFVMSVIAALPPGTTRENYDYEEVVTAVEETLVTYTPSPTQTTEITTVGGPTGDAPQPDNPDPTTDGTGGTGGPSQPNIPNSIPIDANRIRVEGGTSKEFGEEGPLTIRTGEHDQYSCEGEHLNVEASINGQTREYQHWSACHVGGDIVIFLQDHPALTCGSGPNTHTLDIEGLDVEVTVKEDCE